MTNRLVSSPAPRGAALLALCALTLLSGCAGVKRVALHPSERSRLTSVKSVVAQPPPELAVAVTQSTSGAAVGGIFGAIIDSAVTNSRAKDAEAAVVPVRDALVATDAGAALRAGLAKELATVAWLKAGDVELRPVADKAAAAALAAPGDTKYLLLVQPDYRLSPTFNAIVCSAKVTLMPRIPASPGEDLPAPTYHNTFTSTATLAGLPADAPLAEAAKRWADDDGKAAKAAVVGGMAELARMIAFDLGEAAPAEGGSYAAAPGAKEVSFRMELVGAPVTGAVVREEGGRTWARLSGGELAGIAQATP